MASEIRYEIGDPVGVWGESGATILGHARTLGLAIDALANGFAWQGEKLKLDPLYSEYILISTFETGTAPTAGTTIDVYAAWGANLAASPSTPYGFPIGVTGSDGSFTAAYRTTLGLPLPVIMQNVTNTENPGIARRVIPQGNWFVPVIYNGSGQAIRNQTTNSDNKSGLVLYPLKQILVTV